MRGITKQSFLESRKCVTRGWYNRALADGEQLSEADTFWVDQGVEIGRIARQVFAGGVLVEGAGLSDAVRKTQQLMDDPEVCVLFEATFRVDDYTAKADILVRNGNGWKVIEVKSSLHDPKVPDDLADDLAYTVMVASRCGINVNVASLWRISRDFRQGMNAEELFRETDATALIQQRLPDFSSRWNEIREATFRSERPAPVLGQDCADCPYFATHCLGRGVDHAVWEIRRRTADQNETIRRLGILDLRAIPDDFPLNDQQCRVVACAKTGKPYIGSGLAAALGAVAFPVYYLDFETVMTALPLYPDTAPHAQVVTQYSIHKCGSPGRVDRHVEYLADPTRDCQRELAERLVEDLGTEGSIVVYSSFERQRIGELARRFPDLAEPLATITERLFDLLQVVRTHYYDPAFHGRYSIKTVLPVLVPDMTYEGMAIGDGGAAMTKFARMALGQCSRTECEATRRDLLTYCGQDTMAMVRLHEVLGNLCRAQ